LRILKNKIVIANMQSGIALKATELIKNDAFKVMPASAANKK